MNFLPSRKIRTINKYFWWIDPEGTENHQKRWVISPTQNHIWAIKQSCLINMFRCSQWKNPAKFTTHKLSSWVVCDTNQLELILLSNQFLSLHSSKTAGYHNTISNGVLQVPLLSAKRRYETSPCGLALHNCHLMSVV